MAFVDGFYTSLFFFRQHTSDLYSITFIKGDCIFVHLDLVQERGRRPVYDVELKKDICPHKVF